MPAKLPGTDGASPTDRPTVKYLGRREQSGAVVLRLNIRGESSRYRSGSTSAVIHPPVLNGVGSSPGPAQRALTILADAVGAENARSRRVLPAFQDRGNRCPPGRQLGALSRGRSSLAR